MAINFVHPSVSSTITDNSTVYITASGTTKLFAVFTSEKGIDNEIKMITSASEFEFNYGEPNMKLYGQTGYNIVNWLNAGGVVYCLRVLPEDAGYANAIVNIQTKVSTKEVLDANGDLVKVDNVELRPCVSYTEVNNTSKTALEFNELRRSTKSTVDGYKNNMLFAVIPKGRGKGYNNLGFRFTLTDAYDSTYEFRLYNFEVTTTSNSGNISTIQGPFLVSLDPDAMSQSGSSLFIVDVIDRHCDYFSIIFNENAYEELANIINPYVHPNKIDFFNADSRIVNDKNETYYDERTKREEDVHMSVIKYVEGLATTEKNIVNADDAVEASIVLVDNAYRNEQYDRNKDTFDRVKEVLSIVRKIKSGAGDVTTFTSVKLDTIKNGSNEVTLNEGITWLESDKTVEDSYSAFEVSKATLENDVTEEHYTEANNSMNELATSIRNLIDQLYEVYDYAKISQGINADFATKASSILTDLQYVEANIKSLNVTELNCNKYKNTVSELLVRYNDLENSNNNSEKQEFLFEIITKIGDISSILANISDNTESNTFANDKLVEIENHVKAIKDCYDILTDEYITDEDYESVITAGWEHVSELLAANGLLLTINLTLLEKKSFVYDSIKNTLFTIKTDVLTFIKDVISNIATFDYELAKTSVISIENAVEQMRQYTHQTFLQNYDSYIGLAFGSDGSIEGVSYNSNEVEKLIIKGYTGDIDNSLTDKDQWPIDMVLDANYSAPVKNAIATLCTEIRDDFMGILDTQMQATPTDAINYRKNSIGVNNFRLAIFTQDFVITDTEYTGNNIQVTPTYFLASKIPANDNSNGIHWNFVGPRRGTISGYKSISFLPNPEWRERLYNAQVNYVQQDQVSTRFGTQLTSQTTISALSNISCVRTLLRIQRDVEDLMKSYQFEFNDGITITNAQTALNGYLNQWLANRGNH